jgi:phosphatidylglycerol:prolipoprotein diacylglycerol transferase
MDQVIYRIHMFGYTIPLYGYGLMLVIAFLACVTTSKWLARHYGIDPELFVNAALIALCTGVIGARLCHVLENFPEYSRGDLTLWQNLRNVINIREGGLTFYGGFLLATPCCIAYAWWNKVSIKLGMDIVAPVLMIGLGFGRIGCFLNGCCYGAQCNLPWGVQFPYYSNAYIDQFSQNQVLPPPGLMNVARDGTYTLLSPQSPQVRSDPRLRDLANTTRALPVQPTQLYSAFTAFLLAGLLIAYLSLRHVDGRVFALMLMLEGIARFILETIRVEPAVAHFKFLGQTYGWSISMILGLIVSIAGVALWFIFAKFARTETGELSNAEPQKFAVQPSI